MFPEYRDLISQLKTSHPRFQSLFMVRNFNRMSIAS